MLVATIPLNASLAQATGDYEVRWSGYGGPAYAYGRSETELVAIAMDFQNATHCDTDSGTQPGSSHQMDDLTGWIQYFNSAIWYRWVDVACRNSWNGEPAAGSLRVVIVDDYCDSNGFGPPPCLEPEEGYVLAEPSPETPPCNKSNPCNPANGNKSQTEIDYSAPSGSFSRFYNSSGANKTGSGMGAGWRHTYSRALDEQPDSRPTVHFAAPPDEQSAVYPTPAAACSSGWIDIKDTAFDGDLTTATPTFTSGNVCKLTSGGSTVGYLPIRATVGFTNFSHGASFKSVTTALGFTYEFEYDGNDWINELNPELSLVASGSDWVFTDTNDTQETFNASGQLVSITYRNGQTESLDYGLSVAQGGDGNSSTLDRVVGPFGHELTFEYTDGVLASVTTPDGVITYAYDSRDNLTTVTYPDNTVRQYHYEDTAFLGNHLTGITDENGDRFASWGYDTSGRAIFSEHANGKERVDFSYNTNGTTTLTDANGAVQTYTFDTVQGQLKVESLSGDVCSTCPGGDIKSRDYDGNGFLSEVTDWNNNVTKLTRNSRGLVETLVEGFGTAVARTTSVAWHSSFRLPTQVTSPRNVTDYTYDTDGNVLTATISGGGNTRVWTFTYNADGQVATINGPRTGVTDLTTLDYYSCTTGDECGQLETITNALGHITTFDTYDSAGRLTQMTDPNGLATSYTYDLRGRVLAVTETPSAGAPRVTTMTYDDAGQLATYTFPNGTALTYTYSDAHYVTSVSDNLGNSISYDYDAMGNLTDEDTFDPLLTLKQSMDYVIDQNDRLDSATHGPVMTDVTYDLVGNLTSATDGNSAQTQHAYDALNRLDTTTDALLGLTDYNYDDHDNLTQVVAPNGATTSFVYDQLDNLLSETSPDRGLVTYTYDDAGNRLTETDARNITGTYTYDALNRPLTVTYPNVLENITFTYDDAASEGIGRLRSIADQSGTITFAYNEFGEVVSDQRQIGSNALTTSYSYDAAGNTASVTYPSGRTVTFTRNALGQVTGVTSSKGGVQKTVVSAAGYEPFGPLQSVTFGNGAAYNYDHRQDYRLSDYSASGIVDKSYSYDGAGNITQIADLINTNDMHTFSYDSLNRLSSETNHVDYKSRVLNDAPLVYFRLGESSGTTVTDASGNGNSSTYIGTIEYSQPGLVTGADTAVRSGTYANGYVDGLRLTSSNVTGVESWFRTDSTTQTNTILALHYWKTSQFIIQHVNDGYLWVWHGGALQLSSDNPVSAGQAHHVAVWYDAVAGQTRMMVDGILQANTYTGNLLNISAPELVLGGYKWGGSAYPSFVGEIDEVAIYDTQVSSTTFANRTLPIAPGITNTLTYDASGNRTTLDDGAAVTSYGYQAASNRLTAIGGTTVQRDASGNRIADPGGTRTYTYSNTNRLNGVLDSGSTTATYVHNALGQRTKKTVGGSDVIYVYDLAGNLIAEHDATGALIRDYVWMNGAPVAQIDAGEVFRYLHVDHLGTPRLATDDSQTVVWRWDGDAFGSSQPDEDPDANGTGTTINLRFPGQYFDGETGFHYNYFRTYDPSTGRYLESDPIGLGGGLNTYGYVGGNPLGYIDSDGLSRSGRRTTGAQNANNSISYNYLTARIRQFDPSFTPPSSMNRTGAGIARAQLRELEQILRQHQLRAYEAGNSSCLSPSAAAARREAMRALGIPNSLLPSSQSNLRAPDGTPVGRQQTYLVPRLGGGTQPYSVQISRDRVGTHAGRTQVEAGRIKPGSRDSAGRPRIENTDKIRVDIYPPRK